MNEAKIWHVACLVKNLIYFKKWFNRLLEELNDIFYCRRGEEHPWAPELESWKVNLKFTTDVQQFHTFNEYFFKIKNLNFPLNRWPRCRSRTTTRRLPSRSALTCPRNRLKKIGERRGGRETQKSSVFIFSLSPSLPNQQLAEDLKTDIFCKILTEFGLRETPIVPLSRVFPQKREWKLELPKPAKNYLLFWKYHPNPTSASPKSYLGLSNPVPSDFLFPEFEKNINCPPIRLSNISGRIRFFWPGSQTPPSVA